MRGQDAPVPGHGKEVPMVRFKTVITALVVTAVVLSHFDGILRAQAPKPPADRSRARDLPVPLPSAGSSERKTDMPLPVTVSPPTILKPETHPIDLDTALRLGGVQNPELNAARQR